MFEDDRMTISSPLLDLIEEAQVEGIKERNRNKEKIRGQITNFATGRRGLLNQCGKVWVPVLGGVRKIYRDLRLSYWYPSMKREIAWHVKWCLTHPKVKVDHHIPPKKLQPLEIPI